MKKSPGIPIVDLSTLASSVARERRRVEKELVAACREPGSFYVVNHGISERVIAEAFSVARLFFARPDAEKMAIHARKCPPYRGYVCIQERKLGSAALLDAVTGLGDLKENPDLGPALPEDDPAVRPGNPLYGPNVWPEQPPGFRGAIEEYREALDQLSCRLIGGIELGLELEERSLTKAFERPLNRMKIIHYPPPPSRRCIACSMSRDATATRSRISFTRISTQ